MYKYIILGSGKQGTAIAYDLARFGNPSKIILADISSDIARESDNQDLNRNAWHSKTASKRFLSNSPKDGPSSLE